MSYILKLYISNDLLVPADKPNSRFVAAGYAAPTFNPIEGYDSFPSEEELCLCIIEPSPEIGEYGIGAVAFIPISLLYCDKL